MRRWGGGRERETRDRDREDGYTLALLGMCNKFLEIAQHAFEVLLLTVPVSMEICGKSVARHWQESLTLQVTQKEAILFSGLSLMRTNTLPPSPHTQQHSVQIPCKLC